LIYAAKKQSKRAENYRQPHLRTKLCFNGKDQLRHVFPALCGITGLTIPTLYEKPFFPHWVENAQ